MSKKCAIVVELGSSKIVLRQSLCDAINLYVESGVNEFYISIDQIFGRWALEYIRKKFPKVKCVACTVHYEDANKDYEGITIEDYSGYGRMRLKVIVEHCDCAILITYHTPDSRGTFRSMIGWAQRHVRNSDLDALYIDLRDGKIRPTRQAMYPKFLLPKRYHQCTFVVQSTRYLNGANENTLSFSIVDELERCILDGITQFEIILCSDPLLPFVKELYEYPDTTCKIGYPFIILNQEIPSDPIRAKAVLGNTGMNLLENTESDYVVFVGNIGVNGTVSNNDYFEQLIQTARRKQIDSTYVTPIQDNKFIRYIDGREMILSHLD